MTARQTADGRLVVNTRCGKGTYGPGEPCAWTVPCDVCQLVAEYRLAESAFTAEARAARDYEGFAKAVLALTYTSDDGSEFEHSEGCDGQSECGACWAADIRRVADQHLGGDR